MSDLIPTEAVEAAARALHSMLCLAPLMSINCEHPEDHSQQFTRPAEAALAAAAPHILAARDEQLRALRDEWSTNCSAASFVYHANADELDAILEQH